jgi:hypothetical protein
MNLTYRPKNSKANFVTTNLGEFYIGQSRLITKESDITEANRLIANGDFYDSYSNEPHAPDAMTDDRSDSSEFTPATPAPDAADTTRVPAASQGATETPFISGQPFVKHEPAVDTKHRGGKSDRKE